MGYYIDLQRITMDQYKAILKTADLLPSRKILQNNIDENFTLIKAQNIANVDELRKALKNKRKVEEFSRKSRLSADYLKILIREVNSYRQPPIKLRDFPGVSASVILKLENLGITNTLQLFDHILTPQSRQALSERAGVDQHDLLTLAKLTDLGRIRWVNHTFAYVLLETGYETAEQVAKADHRNLYAKVKALNENRQIFKGHIGLHDMKLCVEAAKDLSIEVVI